MTKVALPNQASVGSSLKRAFGFMLIAFLLPTLSWSQGFTISGTQLRDANGNNFIMKGINVPLAWFINDVNGNIANIRRNTNANTLRIVVSTSTSDAAWQTCVQNCITNRMIPMVELHSATGSNNPSDLQRMADWWASKASFLRRSDIARYILINIANEWGDWYMSSPDHAPAGTVWRDAYINAVRTLRNAGINTTIVVDAPGYGQDNRVNTLLSYAPAVQSADPRRNVLFSIHMYCEWRKGGSSSITTHLPQVKNAGIPVIVGEFGFQHASDGSCDIDEQLILNTAQSNGIGWLAWSWKGNGSSVAYLDLSRDWAGTSLTSWGNTVVNGTNGTKTAATASVFGGTTSGCGTAPNGYPYCCNGSASDPDGDGWGWENSRSCVVRGGPAGRLDIEAETAVSRAVVHPNPSSNEFTLEQSGSFGYSIHGLSGKKLEEGQGTDKTTIGKGLTAGIYLLRIQSAKGTKVIKLVKN